MRMFKILFFILLTLGTYKIVNAKIYGKNNFELSKDPDFVGAVKLVIKDYYHKGDLVLANSIKKIIEEYCYVNKENNIKCK